MRTFSEAPINVFIGGDVADLRAIASAGKDPDIDKISHYRTVDAIGVIRGYRGVWHWFGDFVLTD